MCFPFSSVQRPCIVGRSALTTLLFALSFLVLGGLVHAQPVGQPEVQTIDPEERIATNNAYLLRRIAEREALLDEARSELAYFHQRKQILEKGLERIEQRAQVKVLGREFVQAALEELRHLPKPAHYKLTRQARDRALATTSDEILRYERELDDLSDREESPARYYPAQRSSSRVAERTKIDSSTRATMTEQRRLLAQLIEIDGALLKTLLESKKTERELMQVSEAAHTQLSKMLFWVPAQFSAQTFVELRSAGAWTVSWENWRGALTNLLVEVSAELVWPVFLGFCVLLLLVTRSRLKRILAALAPSSGRYRPYRIGHTVAALLITLALALPGPVVFWAISLLLGMADESQIFSHALAAALAAAAKLLLATSVFARLIDQNGVAVAHFGWDEPSLNFSARALRRFSVVFVLLIFLASLNGLDYAPYANRESLGFLAFILAMLALAGFFAYLFKTSSPPVRRLIIYQPHSWMLRFHKLWYFVLIAVPLSVAGLALAGYYAAAGYFFSRVLYSAFFVIGAITLYGLIALWVQTEHARLERLQREEKAKSEAEVEAEAEAEEDGEVAIVVPHLDVATIGEQTRSLLDFFITLFLLGGLWSVWKGALPVLSVIGDYSLWTSRTIADGKEVVFSLSVGHVFLALLVASITTVAVRNVGALLDIVLLKRLEMRADATYAIKVVTRYALTAIGVAAASRVLDIGWNNLQWLVAALSVGLGFGLQEIFANFVSGLIVLAERPIRIGDVVTVGDVTGTVARIRARATAVIDFDNKEVIIPNKAFITDRVINWTLSTGTTRLLIKVGVAYGCDTALVQKLLLEVVQANDDVLEQPSPSVYFIDFGDSSLNFEIRAFVDAFDKRLRVQHEINTAIDGVLREHGIEIPFPQRDLHIRSAEGLAGLPVSPAAKTETLTSQTAANSAQASV